MLGAATFTTKSSKKVRLTHVGADDLEQPQGGPRATSLIGVGRLQCGRRSERIEIGLGFEDKFEPDLRPANLHLRQTVKDQSVGRDKRRLGHRPRPEPIALDNVYLSRK